MREASPALAPSRAVAACGPLALQHRLEQISARHPAVDATIVAEVVRAVLATMDGDLSPTEVRLLAEIEELGDTVSRARAEVAALRVDDITESHIPVASDELEAVVTHTAAATDRILAACEALDALALGMGESWGPSRAMAAAALRAATTDVYEACSFQDLTGQRIAKVVGALQAIDLKVSRIMETFGDRGRRGHVPRAAIAAADPRALLRGPQLPASAMEQRDIDQLMASR